MIARTSLLLLTSVLSATPTSPHVARMVEPPVVTVRARDFALSAPKSITQGPVTFRLVNDGRQMHQLSVLRLAKGKTIQDYVESIRRPVGPQQWVSEAGGPPAVEPGGTYEVTMNLEPGEYVLICSMPSRGERSPQVYKGMLSGLTVVAGKPVGTEPVASDTIHLKEYEFKGVSLPMKAGRHVFNVVNDEDLTHELMVVRLNPGKTLKDFQQYIAVDLRRTTAPGQIIGGTAPLSRNRSATFAVKITPGHYGIFCFAPDLVTGRPHTDRGEVLEFTVK